MSDGYFHIFLLKRVRNIYCRFFQTDFLSTKYRQIDQAKSNNVKNFLFFTFFANTNMADTYVYFEPRTTWPRSLVVEVSDFGARGPGSISGWAPIIHCFLFLLFLAL